MGYTIYWKTKPGKKITTSETKKIVKSLRTMVNSIPKVKIETIGQYHLFFNGIGENSHETFAFEGPGEIDFAFCKTARKPYDKYVKKALMRIQKITGNKLIIHQDGFNPETDPPGWKNYVSED